MRESEIQEPPPLYRAEDEPYQIVTAVTIEDLKREVNNTWVQGYRPFGDIGIDEEGGSAGDPAPQRYYYQVMIRG